MKNDDRIPAVWLQCLQAATSIIVRQDSHFDINRSELANQVAGMADYLYQQYDNRFGLKYAEDGSGRVVGKHGTKK